MSTQRIFVAEFITDESRLLTHKASHDRLSLLSSEIASSLNAQVILFGYKEYTKTFVKFSIPTSEISGTARDIKEFIQRKLSNTKFSITCRDVFVYEVD